jgi:4-hydroxybutyrate dehydrogenase
MIKIPIEPVGYRLAALGLAQLGVTRAMFPDIVRGALKDHSHRTNPRVASDEDYMAMLEGSM